MLIKKLENSRTMNGLLHLVLEEEIRTTLGITPTTTTFTSPIRTSYTSSPAPFPAPQAQVPAGFQKPQLLQSSAFRAPTFQAASPVQVPDPALPRKSIIRQPQVSLTLKVFCKKSVF